MSDLGGAGGPGRRNDGGTQTGKAVLVIVVMMVLGWIVLRHGPSTHGTAVQRTSASVATTTTVPTTTTTLVPPASIKLQVLNGTGHGNLAGQWSSKLKATAGYDTLPPDDATSTVTSSAIYVMTAGYVPEAYALASAVGLPRSAVNTTIPAPSSVPIKASERSKANLVLVIGPDLASKA